VKNSYTNDQLFARGFYFHAQGQWLNLSISQTVEIVETVQVVQIVKTIKYFEIRNSQLTISKSRPLSFVF